jgi:uncharacterized phage infection (PIP) family protein YhgE
MSLFFRFEHSQQESHMRGFFGLLFLACFLVVSYFFLSAIGVNTIEDGFRFYGADGSFRLDLAAGWGFMIFGTLFILSTFNSRAKIADLKDEVEKYRRRDAYMSGVITDLEKGSRNVTRRVAAHDEDSSAKALAAVALALDQGLERLNTLENSSTAVELREQIKPLWEKIQDIGHRADQLSGKGTSLDLAKLREASEKVGKMLDELENLDPESFVDEHTEFVTDAERRLKNLEPLRPKMQQLGERLEELKNRLAPLRSGDRDFDTLFGNIQALKKAIEEMLDYVEKDPQGDDIEDTIYQLENDAKELVDRFNEVTKQYKRLQNLPQKLAPLMPSAQALPLAPVAQAAE